MYLHGGRTYLWQSNVGHNNSVQSAGSVAQRLALVAVRVVLVFKDFALILTLPWHGGFADADVAFGGYGGGLAAEEPVVSLAVAQNFCRCFPLGV